ncbi:MAG: PHP domain-containing protein [Solirubrobacteraceae bacterium]
MSVVKAAIHVHSEWSYDAQIPLPDLATLFARQGYDAVFMCEHDRGFTVERKHAYDAACARASEHGALLIPGIEYADAADRVHTPTWGPLPFLGEGVETIEVLRCAHARGGAAVIAHPVRREAWRVVEPAWLELCTGIEIWTRKWDGWAPNPWAVRQVAERDLLEIVSLDLHQRRQTFPLAMELDVEGDVTAAACVHALRQGRSRALVRGFPVTQLTHGPPSRAVQRLERVRRPVWRQGRLVRNRLTRGR